MPQRDEDITDIGDDASEWLFNIPTPLGFFIHTTKQYWEFIISVKHPIMRGRLESVIRTLEKPDEIRQSRTDENVFLFYREGGGFPWICAVVKSRKGTDFLILTYPTDKIKKGTLIWKR